MLNIIDLGSALHSFFYASTCIKCDTAQFLRSFSQMSVPIPLRIPELVEKILRECDASSNLNLAATAKTNHSIVLSLTTRQVNAHVCTFIDEPYISTFWELLNSTHAAIGVSCHQFCFPRTTDKTLRHPYYSSFRHGKNVSLDFLSSIIILRQ